MFFVFCGFFFFFLKINFFKKIFLEYHQCQTVWIQISPDVSSGLIWVQTVCTGYQQMTKVATSWERINRGDCLIQVAFKAGLTICLKMYDNVPYDLHPVRAQIILHKHPSDLSCFWALQHPNKMHILNGK